MKKQGIFTAIAIIAAVPVMFATSVSAAKKGGVEGVGGLRYFIGSGSCEALTTNVTVTVGSGYANAVYTVSANGATTSFTTDRYGKGVGTLAVPAPSGVVEYADVTTSVKGVSRTDNVELTCSVEYGPAPTPLPIINPYA